MKDGGLISIKELQAKYQTLLAENRLLKEDLKALKTGLGVTELLRQEKPCLSQGSGPDPENIIRKPTICTGSINLLSFGSAEESIMRLESPVIANELIKTVHNS